MTVLDLWKTKDILVVYILSCRISTIRGEAEWDKHVVMGVFVFRLFCIYRRRLGTERERRVYLAPSDSVDQRLSSGQGCPGALSRPQREVRVRKSALWQSLVGIYTIVDDVLVSVDRGAVRIGNCWPVCLKNVFDHLEMMQMLDRLHRLRVAIVNFPWNGKRDTRVNRNAAVEHISELVFVGISWKIEELGRLGIFRCFAECITEGVEHVYLKRSDRRRTSP